MVTIGIVVFNNWRETLDLLKKLYQLESPTHNYELILVDNSQQNPMADLLTEAQNLPFKNIRIFKSEQNNIGFARKLIIEKSNTSYVYFTDPDCSPRVQKLQSFVQSLENNPVLVAVGGSNILQTTGPLQHYFEFLQRSHIAHFGSTQVNRQSSPFRTYHLPTLNLMMRKSSALEAGNFSDFFDKVGEDLDLNLRMTRAQSLILCLPQQAVLHRVSPEFKNWVATCFKYGQAQFLTLKKSYYILQTRRAVPGVMILLLIVSTLFASPIKTVIGLTLLYLLGSAIIIFKQNVLQQRKYFSFIFLMNWATHFFYGLGVLYGLVLWLLPHKHQKNAASSKENRPQYRELSATQN
ncbi:MAG: glycosyltransferase [Bdellovibrionia bacterium]